MKVYFVGSISGKKLYLKNYKHIVNSLSEFGCEVIENTIKPTEEDVKTLSDEDKVKYYRRVLKWIDYSDIVVAEVSHPSIGVGHEVSVAIEKQKPVILMHVDGYSPHFMEGLKTDKLCVVKYEFNDLNNVLKDALEFASDQQDTRFNFFISPKIGTYLDWVSKRKRIPRAVYLRKLIEEDIKRNKEFEG
jgi:nucleoside 2-deoxyribosyltransferase